MVAPVVAGIPLVYEMLVGAGILAGGAVAANQMQKEIQTTIDQDPGIIDQALKNIFTGPASRLIDPNFLKEMQAKKPTPTNQGQTNWSDSFKKKAPAAEEDIMKGSLFYEQTPSGIYLGPTVGGIEKGREEARSKPLITPMPVGQQDQTLVTPVPEKTTVLPGMDPAPTPIQNEGFSMPTTPDTSILNQEETPEVTTADFEKEIKIIKSPDTPDTYDVMYDDKIIKQLYKKRTKFEGENEYVVIEPSDGSYDDTFIGLKNSKERVKQNVARQILEDSKQKEKEYLDKLINTIENKDYENFEKIKNHDFENFNLRSKEFKDTLIKYIPKQVDLYRNNAILEQEAIKQTLNRTSNPSGSLIDKPAQIELPDKAALKEESKLGDELFKLSETGTVQDYETFKNNPIIKKKIALSKQLYKDTTANPGYGTAEYWADRPFTKGVNGYKELVKKVYDRKKIKNNKEFYIVMGPSSAGKSTGLVDTLQKETGSFLADSDEIKKLIPEFNNGYNANGVHAESSDINSRILAMAMKAGDNVIYPTTGREAGKLKGIIDHAEKKGYKVYVDLVTADRSVLLLRNLARMLKTNRVVDGDKLLTEEVINGILETYKNLDEKYKRGKPIDTTPKR
jgi:predicted ABC-type ATPase